jgi:hypothetical protein
MPEQTDKTIHLVEAYSQLEPDFLLLCTFTLSMGYIEQKFLNKFKEKYNTKTLIVSSATGVSQSFDDFYAVRGVGTQYILAKVDDTPYAFHPKILLAIDRKLGPILYVSGCNFTYPGMSQNLDAVEFIELRSADRTTMSNLKSYLDGLADLVISLEQEKIISEIARRLPDGLETKSPFTFMHNMRVSIFDQIEAGVQEEIDEVTIISPYFDHAMKALKRFTQLPGKPKCSILCNHGDEHVNLEALPGNVSVYTTSDETGGRFLHAKVYLIKTASQTYSVVGSANCTEPGMLKTPNHEGNWEAVVMREIGTEYAEEFFQSFSPESLTGTSHWKYTAPKKPPIDRKGISFEVITHPGILELQFPKKHLLGALEGNIDLKFVTGAQKSFPLNQEDPTANGSYFIGIESAVENVGDLPFMVELSLTQPLEAHGSAWVIQKSILSRSKATHSLMKKLDELQNDTPEGWDQFDTLMNFITGNLGYLSAHRRKASKKSQSRTQSDSVLTIDGVLEMDETVSVVGHGDMTMADMLHSGARLDNFFESGFLVAEGEDDETEDLGSENKPGRRRGEDTNDDPKPPSANNTPDFELPDLRMIYQDQIIRKYNNRVKKLGSEGSEEDLGSILSSLLFSLKLARFIHVELTHKYPKINRDPKQLFSVIAPILNEIPRWISSTKVQLDLPDETIIDHFEGSELLQELVLNLCEVWIEDRCDLIRFSQKIELVDLLKKYWSQEQIIASVKSLLDGSNRFSPGRRNLIMDSNLVEIIIDSQWRYMGNSSKFANIYTNAMKMDYFRKAREHHQRAVDIMLERRKKSDNPNSKESNSLLNMHEYRTKTAAAFIDRIYDEINTVIGPGSGKKVLQQKNIASLAPKQVDGSSVCPVCENAICSVDWLKFRSGVHIVCSSCNALMIPADEQKEYDYHATTDMLWEEELK